MCAAPFGAGRKQNSSRPAWRRLENLGWREAAESVADLLLEAHLELGQGVALQAGDVHLGDANALAKLKVNLRERILC